MSVDAGSPPASGTSREFPPLYYTIIRVIDGFSNITGKVISLTMLFLVLSITYEVVARYFFRAPTVWVFEFEFNGEWLGLHARLRLCALQGRARAYRYFLGELF